MRFISLALVSLLATIPFTGMAYAGATYEGPDSVPLFHPLCLNGLKSQEDEGGAFDMSRCSDEYQSIVVKQTPDGSYYAKRPENTSGEAQGYVVYQPIGTLDKAMELLLVHDKESQKETQASIYVIGRLPHLSEGSRAFITSIGEGGDRCNGGIQSARLISEAILEVDINVNPATLMALESLDSSGSDNESDQAPQKSLIKSALSSLSLKPKRQLDDRPTTCIGSVTKSYDLLNDKKSYTWVHFREENTRVAVDPYQQCFDELVADFVTPPQTINMQDFEVFKQLFISECKK
ncbi:hypothetical protein [Neptunomonas antarctica]|uniref:Uncharacterized protein n=1 Tax=Neptunomonas antarctica TaxID=619304 RepID=A0A1N7LKI8_9GAMM|nr:hypothetical protein [Neptunomonas antarctica]SIS74336.1 hypothetical protein SAMN05421760_104105 [Neptunomonas antarctica]